MAMNFYQAQMAQNPNLADAAAQQGALDQQMRNAAQLRQQGLMSGAGSALMGAHKLGLLGTMGKAATATAPAVAGTGLLGGLGKAGASAMGALGAVPGWGWAAMGALALANYLRNKD